MQIIVFDLDDTLIDTSRSLIPRAAQESCLAMIEVGLNCTLETCLNIRAECLATTPREDLYLNLTLKADPNLKTQPELHKDIIQAGRKAFYQRAIDEKPELFPEAIETLENLKGRYDLYLVTAGNEKTQQQKIDILNLGGFFKKLLFADPEQDRDKLDCFNQIQNHENTQPSDILSVGNRLDTDIRFAKQLNWQTCYVKYGEYVAMTPEVSFEHPDYEISEIRYLIEACQL